MSKNTTATGNRQQSPNPWQGKVTCTKVQAVENSGNLRAYASVAIGAPEAPSLTIHSLRIVQQPNKAPWVSMPQQKSGERWFNVVWCDDKRLNEEIGRVVLAAWQGDDNGSGSGNESDIPF